MTADKRCEGPWKCFFCGEVFPDGVTAGRHFGEPEGCDLPAPGCVDPLRRDEKARLHAVQLANYEAVKAMNERDAAQEENAQLRAALKPFADGADQIPKDWPDHRTFLIDEKHPDNPKSHCLALATVGDFRKSKAVLGGV